MNMNQKGFVNTALIVLIVVVVGTIGYFMFAKKQAPFVQQINNPTPTPQNAPITTNPISQTACQNLHNEIENDLTKANYCQKDSDCSVLVLGGSYVEFGCYHFVNKDVDK